MLTLFFLAIILLMNVRNVLAYKNFNVYQLSKINLHFQLTFLKYYHLTNKIN